MSLLMPALAALSREARWLAWVAPPFIPYAPALSNRGVELSRILLVRPRRGTDIPWAIEQALRSGTCGAVLAWPDRLDHRGLRRLQLAAESGKSWGVLFRDVQAAEEASPAALRLLLEPLPDGIGVRVLKRRGGGGGALELRLRPVS
jgi:cell division inhibitor SulA/protein ImuA